ncbi:SdiA-regulated domain-containing protein [Neolewinella antarctica]|uniref:Uncharacterized protein YjiK n=1 Tax=Neolewinella antarctica TaxID=442734 RepID=A0ABX0X609_9BACT|nr:SdiA-regulated domain-containing protein [Neolewinella antarctica]NJC24638.1 uncharacterized protein YjiK [Neolewinella antarctica]
MSLLDRPNLLSVAILGIVVLIAGTYGFLTYTQSPDLEHYRVDNDYDFGYDFDNPNDVLYLDEDLDEISGLSPWFGNDEMLAVQDEDGQVFVLNSRTGKIIHRVRFDKDNDYEGIARKDSMVYVLEQDGDLHRFILDYNVDEVEAEKIETPFSYRNDTEGIAYDERTNSLLIVPKEQELNPGENDYRHGIYSFSLESMTMVEQPAYYIDEFEIGQVIYGKRTRYEFKPSGVAVDPISGDIYVIASVGKIMIVIDRESEIKQIELLKESVFRQPEGIEFNLLGDLYISSEAKGGKAVLARYSRKQVTESKKEANE